MSHKDSNLRAIRRDLNSRINLIQYYLDGGMRERCVDGETKVMAMLDEDKERAEKTIAQLKEDRDRISEMIRE